MGKNRPPTIHKKKVAAPRFPQQSPAEGDQKTVIVPDEPEK